MTQQETAKAICKALQLMNEYEWRQSKEQIEELYKHLTETPADIHHNYNPDWGKPETD